MCGIVGYVGKRAVQPLLLEGLSRLEYRGYDSAGISMIAGDEIESVRAVGNLENLRGAVQARDAAATPAGPRTAASTRRTRTRISTRRTACTWSSTGSSRTT
jgi:glucosamine--fructose-6-phosphate aminotransferase (isomerizing)